MMSCIQRYICRRPHRTVLLAASIITSCLICGYLQSTGLWAYTHSLPGLPSADLNTFASHAINNTVVIVPVNAGMLHWAENLLCSLGSTSFDTSKVVFWALDEGAESTLTRKGRATYRDPSLFATSMNENYRGDTQAYRRMMKERPKFFINVLAAGYDILMLDADTVFWQSPLLLLPQTVDESDSKVDAVFSTDAREFYQTHNAFFDARRRGSLIPPICNGIFWMRSSNMTIALWSEMLDVFNAPWPLGWFRRRQFQDDQRGMDVLLNDGRARLVQPLPDGITKDMLPNSHNGKHLLNVRLLDQTLVANGHLVKNRRGLYEANLARLRGEGKERIAAHFNWDTTETTKEEGSREMSMYFLDEKSSCSLHG